jgi:hypothetical protein
MGTDEKVAFLVPASHRVKVRGPVPRFVPGSKARFKRFFKSDLSCLPGQEMI